MTIPDTVDVVRTRRLEVVDEDGTVRIVLYCDRDVIDGDNATIEMYDPKGHIAVDLSTDGDSTLLEVWQRGNPVVMVWSTRDGRTWLEVAGRNTLTPALEWDNSEGEESDEAEEPDDE